MSYQKLLQRMIGVTLVMLLLVGCGAPTATTVSEAPAATSTPVPSAATPIPPTPGDWMTASAEFEMAFTVNPASTGITTIAYESSSDWKCGSVPAYIGVRFYAGIEEESWPISDNEFTITNEFPIMGTTRPPLKTITINGVFDETGTHASVTWEAVSSLGETCSGVWEVSPRE